MIRAVINNVGFKKNRGRAQTEFDFPQCYTKFEIARMPKQGDALQSGGARISERIWYISATLLSMLLSTYQSEHGTTVNA